MCNKLLMSPKIDPDDYITYVEAAALTGLALSTIYTYTNTGKLTPRVIVGKRVLNRKEVEALAKERSK